MKPTMNRAKVAASLREELMTSRSEILASSWKTNYEPYVTEAVDQIEGSAANDGHELLKVTLIKWSGKPAARAAYCIALRT